MGGAVCLSVHGHVDVTALVTYAAPLHNRFAHAADRPQIPSFDIRHDVQGISNIHIFHGEKDETVPLSHARMLHARASDPKRLIILPGGDHRMSDAGVLQERGVAKRVVEGVEHVA